MGLERGSRGIVWRRTRNMSSRSLPSDPPTANLRRQAGDACGSAAVSYSAGALHPPQTLQPLPRASRWRRGGPAQQQIAGDGTREEAPRNAGSRPHPSKGSSLRCLALASRNRRSVPP